MLNEQRECDWFVCRIREMGSADTFLWAKNAHLNAMHSSKSIDWIPRRFRVRFFSLPSGAISHCFYCLTMTVVNCQLFPNEVVNVEWFRSCKNERIHCSVVRQKKSIKTQLRCSISDGRKKRTEVFFCDHCHENHRYYLRQEYKKFQFIADADGRHIPLSPTLLTRKSSKRNGQFHKLQATEFDLVAKWQIPHQFYSEGNLNEDKY